MQTNSGRYGSPPTVGPLRRKAAWTWGGGVPARKPISVASTFDQCKRSTFTVCIGACECGVMGTVTGGGEGCRVEYRRVGA